MRRKFKLYVWPDTLTDYTSGVMFALARSPEEARALIIAAEGAETHVTGMVQTDLKAEPDVYDGPFGLAVWGGG